MVNYYTVKVTKPASLTDEQKEVINSFAKNGRYKNMKVVYSSQIIFDFQTDEKLVPANIKRELRGLEVLSV